MLLKIKTPPQEEGVVWGELQHRSQNFRLTDSLVPLALIGKPKRAAIFYSIFSPIIAVLISFSKLL